MTEKIRIFFCYAHEDEPLLHLFKKHLKPLQHNGPIDLWYDRDINAGKDWEREIKEHLDTAHLVLLLISPDFMNSEYCYSVEMAKALKMHEAGITRVIPIILRPVYWEEAPFNKLQVLPTDGKPINSSYWHNQDEAFLDVVKGVKQAIEELLLNLQNIRSDPKEHIREGFLRDGSLEEVLSPYPDIAEIVIIVLKALSENICEELETGNLLEKISESEPVAYDLVKRTLETLSSGACEELGAGSVVGLVVNHIPGLHDVLKALSGRICEELMIGASIKQITAREPIIHDLLEAPLILASTYACGELEEKAPIGQTIAGVPGLHDLLEALSKRISKDLELGVPIEHMIIEVPSLYGLLKIISKFMAN